MDTEPGDEPQGTLKDPCGLAETPTLSAAASVHPKGFLRLEEGGSQKRDGVTRSRPCIFQESPEPRRPEGWEMESVSPSGEPGREGSLCSRDG